MQVSGPTALDEGLNRRHLNSGLPGQTVSGVELGLIRSDKNYMVQY
jgi:hypothetical protein